LCPKISQLASSTIEKADSVFVAKIKDVAALYKLKLSALVVVAAVLGYYMGTSETNGQILWALCVGGFMLTGGSNGLNQVWEREWDKLMHRTMMRPLPTGRMKMLEATIISSLSGVAGIFILWYFVNPASGILGLLAFFMYVFIYTPLKRVTSLAVFVGAFPGAISPMLGYVAATNNFGLEAGLLFAMQFMWQFPHFWAIAWVSHDDYVRGGYKLLPFSEGRTKRSAFQILIYSLFLIPVSLLPWALPYSQPMVGNLAAAVAFLFGALMAWYSYKLYRSCDVIDARKLMFASFFYLPVVQLFYVIDKLY
jgi:protoheme IX farnesyltransferase